MMKRREHSHVAWFSGFGKLLSKTFVTVKHRDKPVNWMCFSASVTREETTVLIVTLPWAHKLKLT